MLTPQQIQEAQQTLGPLPGSSAASSAIPKTGTSISGQSGSDPWASFNTATQGKAVSPQAPAPEETPQSYAQNLPGKALSEVGNVLSKSAGDIANRAGQLWTDVTKPTTMIGALAGEKPLNVLGDVAGGVNDVIGEGLKGGFHLLPQKSQEMVKQGVGGAMEALGVPGALNKYSDWAAKYPDASHYLESALNVGSLIPMAKGAGLAKEGVEEVIPAGAKEAMGNLGQNVSELGSKIKAAPNDLLINAGRDARGLTESDVATIRATPQTQAYTKEYFDRFTKAGLDQAKQQTVRQGIENDILDMTRDAWNTHGEEMGKVYNSDLESYASKVRPDAPAITRADLNKDLATVADELDTSLDKQGRLVASGGVESERALVGKIAKKIARVGSDNSTITGDIGFKQIDDLRKDVGTLFQTTKPGTPEYRLLSEYYGKIKDMQSSMLSPEDAKSLQATFDNYKEYLTSKSAFKTLTSNKSDPVALQKAYQEIFRGATGRKGTGAIADALAQAEGAGKLNAGEISARIRALEHASKMTGVRSAGTLGAMMRDSVMEGATGAAKGGSELTLANAPFKAVKAVGKAVLNKKADKALLEHLFTPQVESKAPGLLESAVPKGEAAASAETAKPRNYTPKSKMIEEIFNNSSGQKKLGEIGDKEVVSGSFFRKHLDKKVSEGKLNRMGEDDVRKAIPKVSDEFRADGSPKSYRYDNTAHIAYEKDGSLSVIVTRPNKSGKLEIITAHEVPKTEKAKYLENLASFGSPDGN